jgi:hypothetical protein
MARYVNPVPTFNLTQHLSPTKFQLAKARLVYIGGVNKSGSAMIADRVGDFAFLNQKVYYHP